MADVKISALTELTTPADNDEINIVDKSDTTFASTGTNKRITVANLRSPAPTNIAKTQLAQAVQNELDANTAKHGLYPTSVTPVGVWRGVSGNPGDSTTISTGTAQFDGGSIYLSRTDANGNAVSVANLPAVGAAITFAEISTTVSAISENSNRIKLDLAGSNQPLAAQGHHYSLYNVADPNHTTYGVHTKGALEGDGAPSMEIDVRTGGIITAMIGDAQVTNPKIADGTIQSGKLDLASGETITAGQAVVYRANGEFGSMAFPTGGGSGGGTGSGGRTEEVILGSISSSTPISASSSISLNTGKTFSSYDEIWFLVKESLTSNIAINMIPKSVFEQTSSTKQYVIYGGVDGQGRVYDSDLYRVSDTQFSWSLVGERGAALLAVIGVNYGGGGTDVVHVWNPESAYAQDTIVEYLGNFYQAINAISVATLTSVATWNVGSTAFLRGGTSNSQGRFNHQTAPISGTAPTVDSNTPHILKLVGNTHGNLFAVGILDIVSVSEFVIQSVAHMQQKFGTASISSGGGTWELSTGVNNRPDLDSTNWRPIADPSSSHREDILATQASFASGSRLTQTVNLTSGKTLVGHNQFVVSFTFSHNISAGGHVFGTTNRFSKVYDGNEFRASTGGRAFLEFVYPSGGSNQHVLMALQRNSDTSILVSFTDLVGTGETSQSITNFELKGITS